MVFDYLISRPNEERMNTYKFIKFSKPQNLLTEIQTVDGTHQTVRNSDYLKECLYVESKGGVAASAINEILQEDIVDRH